MIQVVTVPVERDLIEATDVTALPQGGATDPHLPEDVKPRLLVKMTEIATTDAEEGTTMTDDALEVLSTETVSESETVKTEGTTGTAAKIEMTEMTETTGTVKNDPMAKNAKRNRLLLRLLLPTMNWTPLSR